jgi:hypothetical protein
MCDDDSKEDGVDNSVDGGDKHLTYLTQVVGCCLKARNKQNVCVDDGKEDGVDNSVDGGDKNPTYLTQVVSCSLKARSEQNACGQNVMISRSKLIGSANSTEMKNVLMAVSIDVSMIVLMDVLVMLMAVKKMVLIIVLAVLTSTSHISHKWLVVV